MSTPIHRQKLPSYRKAVFSWARRKITGRGAALRHPIRTTYKARKYIRTKRAQVALTGYRGAAQRAAKKYGLY